MSEAKRILVVDDDADLREQVAAVLTGGGYEVTQAGGREEAEETLLSGPPDLAVVDLMMEEMDAGFVLCSRIKRLYPGTPVILLTGVTAATGLDFDAGGRDEWAWARADLLLDKPARPERLLSEVGRLLAG